MALVMMGARAMDCTGMEIADWRTGRAETKSLREMAVTAPGTCWFA